MVVAPCAYRCDCRFGSLAVIPAFSFSPPRPPLVNSLEGRPRLSTAAYWVRSMALRLTLSGDLPLSVTSLFTCQLQWDYATLGENHCCKDCGFSGCSLGLQARSLAVARLSERKPAAVLLRGPGGPQRGGELEKAGPVSLRLRKQCPDECRRGRSHSSAV